MGTQAEFQGQVCPQGFRSEWHHLVPYGSLSDGWKSSGPAHRVYLEEGAMAK